MSGNQITTDDSRGSLSQRAYRHIREQIFRGRIPLGAALPRRKLAKELGISPLPVAEALQRLESDGLVESLPRVGTRVKVPRPLDIRGHYVVREALETQAARLFAAKASKEERGELKRMAAELDAIYAKRPDPEVAAADLENHWFDVHTFHMQLHMRIAECTGFPALCEAMEKNQVLTFNWLYDEASERHDLPHGWHSQLAEVLCEQDEEAASEAMRRHVRYGMDEVLKRLQRYAAPGSAYVTQWNGFSR